MFLKKSLVIISIIYLALSWGSLVDAADFDQIKVRLKEYSPDSYLELILIGPFNKSGIASRDDLLFAFGVVENHPKENKLYEFNYQEFRFLSRTGEKTFEVKHYGKSQGPKYNVNEKLLIYFATDDIYPLKFYEYSWAFSVPEYLKSNYFVKCSKSDEAYLKMIKLDGNRLEFQVILPECVRKTVNP